MYIYIHCCDGANVLGLINISQPHNFISYQSTYNIMRIMTYHALFTARIALTVRLLIFSVHTIAMDVLPIRVGMLVE